MGMMGSRQWPDVSGCLQAASSGLLAEEITPPVLVNITAHLTVAVRQLERECIVTLTKAALATPQDTHPGGGLIEEALESVFASTLEALVRLSIMGVCDPEDRADQIKSAAYHTDEAWREWSRIQLLHL